MSTSKTGNTDAALKFLQKVAEAERLSAEVQKGDIDNTVRIAKEQGYEVKSEDIWDAITSLQKNRIDLAKNVPSWIIDRLRVAVHD